GAEATAAAVGLALFPALLERGALFGRHVLQPLFHRLLTLFRRHVGEAAAAGPALTAAEAAAAAAALSLIGARLLTLSLSAAVAPVRRCAFGLRVGRRLPGCRCIRRGSAGLSGAPRGRRSA